MTSTRNVKLYECCTEPYVDIEYNITVKRRSEMYKTVAFTPITIVVLSTLSSFWLPSEAGEKILLNSMNAVILTIFLKYFSNLLPVSATNVPLIGKFTLAILLIRNHNFKRSLILISFQ